MQPQAYTSEYRIGITLNVRANDRDDAVKLVRSAALRLGESCGIVYANLDRIAPAIDQYTRKQGA